MVGVTRGERTAQRNPEAGNDVTHFQRKRSAWFENPFRLSGSSEEASKNVKMFPVCWHGPSYCGSF